MSWHKAQIYLFLILLVIGSFSYVRNAQAIIWNPIKFTSEAQSWETDVITQFYAQRLKSAQSKFPDKPTEILVGRTKSLSGESQNHIYVYLRGNPEFCSAEGCLLSYLQKDRQQEWRSAIEITSNGYFMITDIGENGRRVLVTETNTACVDLIWNGASYEPSFGAGPCFDRRKAALDDAIDETIMELYRAFRKDQIGFTGLAPQGSAVAVSLKFETDRTIALSLLNEVAARHGATLHTAGNSFRLVYDFSDLPRFFVLE